MGILMYIDPGTGSMLFTILIGLVGAGIYSIRMLVLKLKFIISGGKAVADTGNMIPYVIFSDHKRYWSVFEPICREFDKRGIDLVYMTASPDDPVLECPYEHVRGEFIGEGNKAFARLNFLNAGIVISTTPGLDVYQWKRSKGVRFYIHILHSNEIVRYRMFGVDYYDSLLLSREGMIDEIRSLERKRNLPEKELILSGIPYMDEKRIQYECRKNVDTKSGVKVLLAPTWGAQGILARHGEKIIRELINTGYEIIIRPHPQTLTSEKELLDTLMELYPDSEKLHWDMDDDNFRALNESDIMISDFSSVVYDYTFIFDKPVIYTKMNDESLGIYDAWWLDTPLWTSTVLPELGMELDDDNLGELKDMIDDCLNNDRYSKGRDKVRNEAWLYPGKGAERMVDYFAKKGRELEIAV